MEGFWGFLICLFVLYPLAYYCPGSDHGSFENGFNTYTMLVNSRQVQLIFTVYFITVSSLVAYYSILMPINSILIVHVVIPLSTILD